MSNASRQAKYRQTDTGKAKQRERDRSEKRRTAARERRRAARAAATLARPFIALDGEGITHKDGRHSFVILAASTGEQLIRPFGISTKDALQWLIDLAGAHPNAIFVGFGFGYDANMILRDLPAEKVDLLHLRQNVKAGRWTIGYLPNRQFRLRDDITGLSMTVWDVRGYWRSSFVKALHNNGVSVPSIIDEGKAARAHFSLDNLQFMADYNRAELETLVELMDKVRTRLRSVGIKVTRYDGAGSIASVLMRDHVNADTLQPAPEHIQPFVRSAFYGGRIEALKYGHTDEPVWVYDINSAYPAALTQLPDWRGSWEPIYKPKSVEPNSLYLVRWSSYGSPQSAQPFPYRGMQGGLCFPPSGLGWMWSPEVAMLEHLPVMKVEILEGRIFRPDNPTARPFAWVEDVYRQRKQLQADGDKAGELLKLGLAAVWGKLAQQTGWQSEPLKIPRWHHLPSAGMVTSHVRAQIMQAAWPFPDYIVAFETDSIISTRPLDVPLGDGLGQWSQTRYENLTYLGSGLSWATDADGKEWSRTAGIPRGRIDRASVMVAARSGAATLNLGMPQFVGMGLASILPDGWKRWLSWEDSTFELPLRPVGKREPWAIPHKAKWEWSRLNPTLCPVSPTEIGLEYVVEWENPDAVYLEKKARMLELESATNEALGYD